MIEVGTADFWAVTGVRGHAGRARAIVWPPPSNPIQLYESRYHACSGSSLSNSPVNFCMFGEVSPEANGTCLRQSMRVWYRNDSPSPPRGLSSRCTFFRSRLRHYTPSCSPVHRDPRGISFQIHKGVERTSSPKAECEVKRKLRAGT